MPYIKTHARNLLAEDGVQPDNEGELTYELTQVVIAYCLLKGLSFTTCADILAALDATSKEFYRRVVGPYENRKISDNGDVYPPELLSDR